MSLSGKNALYVPSLPVCMECAIDIEGSHRKWAREHRAHVSNHDSVVGPHLGIWGQQVQSSWDTYVQMDALVQI